MMAPEDPVKQQKLNFIDNLRMFQTLNKVLWRVKNLSLSTLFVLEKHGNYQNLILGCHIIILYKSKTSSRLLQNCKFGNKKDKSTLP